MKLEIGEHWHNEQPDYVEEIVILSIEADWIDKTEQTKGDIICPKSTDKVNVKVFNTVRNEPFDTTISLKDLANRFERGEY